MTTKAKILQEIQRIAAENGGKPPGREKFENLTGLKFHAMCPKYWLRWGDALEEAGYKRQTLSQKIPDHVIAQCYVGLIKKIGKVPIAGEVRREAEIDANFPSHSVFDRLGKVRLLEISMQYCKGKEHLNEVLEICQKEHANITAEMEDDLTTTTTISAGCVYLMKSGKHYKIGRTKSLQRRDKELADEIPVPPTTVHYIETDDPSGVEAYWHKRFEEKRGNGEWFTLDSNDVKAFKRWKKIF